VTRHRSQFDMLLKDGQILPLGSTQVKVIYTPGHTIDSNAYLIGDAVFVGDTIFKEDSGTARCDFPNGSASLLWESIQKILSLPGSTRLFLCHDYGAGNKRPLVSETTVESELEGNIHVKRGTSMEEFVQMRDARDATLNLPRLILPSIQFNIQGGLNVNYMKFAMNKQAIYSRNYRKE
jgi:glyoxylase-like metal-dependent hydrolase (beta-lactamase superfamily II)